MAKTQYGNPVVVHSSGASTTLERIQLGDSGHYNEAYIQDLVFEHPESLPIDEIDRAYLDLVPICTELYTPVGPVDGLFITPTGRIVVLEAKLWRNPEARRKVIGQILDYAKEFSRWDYEDLQREVGKRLNRKGNVPYELVSGHHPDLEESAFVDAVNQSLKRGRFLLLIVGDGIREDVGGIAEFLNTVGQLEFTFGLVELALYQGSDGSTVVTPRTLAKTEIIDRIIVQVDGQAVAASEEQVRDGDALDEEPTELEAFYTGFWSEFLGELRLDDPGQPFAKVTKAGNVFFTLPPGTGQAWITLFFVQSSKRVGVFVKLVVGQFGERAYESFVADKERIEQELPAGIEWDPERLRVVISTTFSDLKSPKHREEIKRFFAENVNQFVNTFRPRLSRLVEEND